MKKDALFTVSMLIIAMLISMAVQFVFRTQTLESDIFILAVFLVALKTQGYMWGIIASLVSVLAVNFAFTFPYYKFNFVIWENITAAIIMLAITCTTSTLMTRIKEHERTKAEIEREHMRANLLRAVSHDLRTPLTTIYGSCSTVIENYDFLQREQQIKLLSGIREDSEWLIRMVENLLSVTRIDDTRVKVVKTSTVLDELIDTVLTKFAKQYAGISVQVELPEVFVSIPMDAMLIEQVLMNLMENAVFHGKGMENLILRVEVCDGEAIFEVSDDGCGIPEEQIGKIFSGGMDYSNGPTDGKRKGMGIGLSVCATIIRAHDGKIWAENHKERGVSFFFTLDIEEQEYE